MAPSSMVTQVELMQAKVEREIAERRLAGVKRFLQRLDLSTDARRAAITLRDELEDEIFLLGVFTYADRSSGCSMGCYASSDDSQEQRPYQEGQ